MKRTRNIEQIIDLKRYSEFSFNELDNQRNLLNQHLHHLVSKVNDRVLNNVIERKAELVSKVRAYETQLKEKFSSELLGIFSSLYESLRGKELSEMNFAHWIETSLKGIEDKFGEVNLDRDFLLSIINGLHEIWQQKVDEIKQKLTSVPNEEGQNQEHKQQSNEESRELPKEHTPRAHQTHSQNQKLPEPEETKRPGILQKWKSLFKKNEEESKATEIKLGNEKNFRYDPIKKKYVFEGEDEVEEEENDEPPPTQFSKANEVTNEQESKSEREDRNFFKPPSHPTLRKKNQPSKSQPINQSINLFTPKIEQETQKIIEDQTYNERKDKDQIVSDSVNQIVDLFFYELQEASQKIKFDDCLEVMIENLNYFGEMNTKEHISNYIDTLLLKEELQSSKIQQLKDEFLLQKTSKELVLSKGKLNELNEVSAQNVQRIIHQMDQISYQEQRLTLKENVLSILSISNHEQNLVQSNFDSFKRENGLLSEMEKLHQQLGIFKTELNEKNLEESIIRIEKEQSLNTIQNQQQELIKLMEMLQFSLFAQKNQDDIIISLKSQCFNNFQLFTKVLETFRMQISTLEGEIVRKNESLAFFEKELDKKEKRIREYLVDLTEKDSELDFFAQKVKKLTEENQILENRLQQQILKSQEIRSSIITEKKRLENELYISQSEKKISDQFFQQMKSTNISLENQLKRSEVQLETMIQERNEFQNFATEFIFSFYQDDSPEQENQSHISQDYLGLLARFNGILIEMKDRENDVKIQMQSKIQSLGKKVEQMKVLNQVLEKRNACLLDSYNDLKNQYTQRYEKDKQILNRQAIQILDGLKYSNIRNFGLQSSLAKLIGNLPLEKEHLSTLPRSEMQNYLIRLLMTSSQKILKVNSLLNSLQNAALVKELNAANRELKRQLEEGIGQNQNFEGISKIIHVIQVWSDRMTDKINQLEREKLKLEQALADKSRIEEHLLESNHKITLLEKERDEFQAILEEKINEINSLFTKQQTLIDEKLTLERTYKEEIRNLESQIDTFCDQTLKLKQSISDLENDLKNKELLIIDLEKSKADNDFRVKELENMHQEDSEKVKINSIKDIFVRMANLGGQEALINSIIQIFDEKRDVQSIILDIINTSQEFLNRLNIEIGEKERVISDLNQSLTEMNENNKILQNNIALLDSQQEERSKYDSLKEIYEKKSKKVEELTKELSEKNAYIDNIRFANDEKGVISSDQDHILEQLTIFKQTNSDLKAELIRVLEEQKKISEQNEEMKNKLKNYDEEHGTKLHSYADIIKKLSIQLDEVKKQKGFPTYKCETKGTQFPEFEKESDKNIDKNDQKKSGFFVEMAQKLFLTDNDLKKM